MYVLFIKSNVVNLKSSKSCVMITNCNATEFVSLFNFTAIWDETMVLNFILFLISLQLGMKQLLLDFAHFSISPTWDQTMLLNFIHNTYAAHEHLHITANGKHNTWHVTCGVMFHGSEVHRFSPFSITLKEGSKGQTRCILFVQISFNVISKSYLERCFTVLPVALYKYNQCCVCKWYRISCRTWDIVIVKPCKLFYIV